jgi:tetratricopeptide (TPR) repeat protein
MTRTSLFILLLACALLASCASAPLPSQVLREQIDEDRRLGRPSQALYGVEVLAARDGWSDDLSFVAGTLRADLGDLDGALAAWSRIAAPDEARLREIARAQLQLERWADVRATLARLLRTAPDDGWAQLQYGILAISADVPAARAAFDIASRDPLYRDQANAIIALFDADVEADATLRMMRLGLAFVEQQQWAYAEMSFAQAATLDAPYPEALAALGFARVMGGKTGADDLLAAVALAPEDARVRYFQGITARAQGDLPGALDALGQAVALDPQNAALYVELAQTYRAARDLEQAERWLLLAVDVAGGDARYRETLALFYADEAENLTTSGVDALQALLGALPPSADAQAGYGWAMYLAGDRELGQDMIARVLAVAPENARARYYQARILIDGGDAAGAAELLEQLVQSNSAFAARAAALLEGLEP